MLKRTLEFLLIPLALLVAFASSAFATGQAAGSDSSIWDLARQAYDAVAHGQWWLGAALALVLLVATARKYAAPRWPWLNGDAGASLLVLLGSYGGALAMALAAGASPMSAALAWTALKVALGAAGGYSLIKKLLIDPLVRPHVDDAPAWLRPVLAALVWAFDHVPKAGAAPRDAVEDHRTGDAAGEPYAPSAGPPPTRRDHR